MAMKDILGRFKREAEEDFVPEEVPTPEEKPSFVFTDVNSEPIGKQEGPVRVDTSDNDRIQVFELDLGKSHAERTTTPEPEAPIYAPEPEIPEPEDTITVAPTPTTVDATDEYEVDFGYAAPGALDEVTYTTDPASVPKPSAPEPVVYREESPADNGEEEYYDSYEPIYEESYTPGSYFAHEAAVSVEEPYIAPAEPEPEPVEPEVPEETYEAPIYADEEARPRYENYRKDYRKASTDAEPRTYENNIDDSVFLPDEGETPVRSRRNRRKMTIALVALLVAVLFVLGGVLISHFKGRSTDDAALSTSAKVKTTAFERSVSNNADATETTTEEASAEYDENGEISESTTSASEDTTRRRTSTTTRSSSTSTTTTHSTTASTTRSTTASTTAPTQAPTTQPSTSPPTQAPTTQPSPWDHVNS